MTETKKKIPNLNTIFMVPTLGISGKQIEAHNLINAYSKDEEKDEYSLNKHVFLLFKPKNMDNFQWFIDEEYDRTEDILEDYNVDKNLVILVYKLNEKFKEDFDLVREGKYSKTSEKFQNLFKKTKTVVEKGESVDTLSLQWKIFTKDETLREFWEGDDMIGAKIPRDQEVWPGYNLEKETLSIEKIKQLL